MNHTQEFHRSNRQERRLLPFNVANYIAVALLALAVTGCDATLTPTPSPETSVESLGDEVIAFGRVRWRQNGEEQTRDIVPHYLRLEDMRTGKLKVTKDGEFTWKLPRGTYLLHQLHWWDPWDGPHRLTPKVAFELSGSVSAYCLGTLVIDIRGQRDIVGGLWVEGFWVHVEDDCAQRTREMRARYVDPNLSYAKLLMVSDPRMPDRPQELKDRDALRDFLRAILPGLMTIQ